MRASVLIFLIGSNFFASLVSFQNLASHTSIWLSESARLYSNPRSVEWIPRSSQHVAKENSHRIEQTLRLGLLNTLVLASRSSRAIASEDLLPISLGDAEPRITNVCWLDFVEKGSDVVNRVEVSLYGEIVPQTVRNFIELCTNRSSYSYVGSEVFRVISDFSVQIGNVGVPPDVVASQRSQYGRSSVNDGRGFEIENYRILHDYPTAGVVSMMKDKFGKQDSRFFITFKPAASWADDNYAAFGRVTKGLDFILSLEQTPVKKPSNHPVKAIEIVASGCYDL